MNYQSIAIDGPSGAGKSTMAKAVAARLGFLYVDTGAIYRTLGLFALRRGVAPGDALAVERLLPQVSLHMAYGEDGLQHMYLGEEDVTEAIRKPEVSVAASQISALPEVRAYLLEMQRDLARRNSVVMDGRDIGTVVLPQADVKIFLTASAEDRARRRYLELLERGSGTSYEEVLADLVARDERDTKRAAAPLRRAEDATLVDTSGKTPEESLALLLQIIQERFAV